MKKHTTKILAMLIALVLLLALLPTAALADSYDGAGGVTIDTAFTTESLSTAVLAQQANPLLITSLDISAGELGNVDIYWIRDNLTNLASLRIRDTATVRDTLLLRDNSLPRYAFMNLSSLAHVEIPSLTNIGVNAFTNCTSLLDAHMINVQMIGYGTFEGCDALTSVGFPKATVVFERVFRSCDALVSVELIAVESIGNNAFRDCTVLTALKLGTNVPTLGTDVFLNTAVTKTAGVPESVLSAFVADTTDGNGTDNVWHGWTLYGMNEDNTLASLTTNIGTLLPTFDSGVGLYDIYVDEGAATIIVTPTATSPKTLLFRNNSGFAQPIVSGVAQAFNLDTDVTVITFMLFPESGSTQLFGTPPWNEYEITVTKGDPPIENPDTGDNQNLLWIYLCAGAVLCAAAAIVLLKKRSKQL